MEEEETAPVAVEAAAVEAAPVADAPVAEAPVTEASAADAPSTPDYPTLDSFEWDSWDGGAEALPEPVRGWGASIIERTRSAADKEWQKKLAESEQMARIYEEMMSGHEDPRIAEFTGKLSERQTAFEELQAKYDAQSAEYGDTKKAWEARQEEETSKWVQRFERQHADIAKDPKQVQILIDLLNEGWDDDIGVELLKLGPTAVKIAREAAQAGTPPEYAFRLAKAQLPRATKAKPSPAAVAMAGASGGPRHTSLSKMEPLTGNTFEDRKAIAIRRNLKRSKGSRR